MFTDLFQSVPKVQLKTKKLVNGAVGIAGKVNIVLGEVCMICVSRGPLENVANTWSTCD